MSELETGKTLDNSARQPLTGWKLWWRAFTRQLAHAPAYYKDSAFPACPACGSPNVMLTDGDSYLCLERDCKSRGPCEVEGSDGVERAKAKVRGYVVMAACLAIVLVLAVTTGAVPLG